MSWWDFFTVKEYYMIKYHDFTISTIIANGPFMHQLKSPQTYHNFIAAFVIAIAIYF